MKRTAAFLLLLAACSPEGNNNPPRDPGQPTPPATKDQTPAAPPNLGITYEPPAEWKTEKPASNMRKAQYAVPDKDKTEGDATLVYFGTMGGGVDGNFNRWKGQFRNPPADPKEEQMKAGDATIHLLDIAGEYASDAGADPKPDQRGLFAIVETATGDHIFRLTGPRGTVGDWRDAFVEMLKKIKSKGA